MERPAPVSSPAIRPINKAAVHRICAGQVILDLSSAVKELVENSLDASATSVEVVLKDYGEEWFQVIDNGFGISPDSFKVLALKHHTSKLADFPDLQSLATFGFRGEALSSLCTLAELTVETRTKDEPVASLLTFDQSGALVGERKTARQVGTTVTVKKLFSRLPVRSKEFKRNIRKEYGKLVSLLNAYAVIVKGVRITCTNKTGKNSKYVLKTQGSDSLKDNIITVLGINTFNCLQPASIPISDGCQVDGFVSKPGQGSGRTLGDRQYYFVNGRPVDLPKVSKLVNELYKGANSRQYPIAILNFTVPTRICDVNVTPDKRKIFFSEENSIMLALRDGLQKIYAPSNASFSVNSFSEQSQTDNICSSKFLSSQEMPQAQSEKSPSEVCFGKGNRILEYNLNEDDPLHTDGRQSVMANSGEKLTKDFAFRKHEGRQADSSAKSNEKFAANHVTVEDHLAPLLSTVITRPGTRVKDSSANTLGPIQSTLSKFVTINKRKHEDVSRPLSEVPILRSQTMQCQLKKQIAELLSRDEISPIEHMKSNDATELTGAEPSTYLKTEMTFEKRIRRTLSSKGSACDGGPPEEPSLEDKSSHVADASIASPLKGLETLSEDLVIAPHPLESSRVVLDAPLPSSQKIFSLVKFNFENLRKRRQQRLSILQSGSYKSEEMKISRRSFVAASLKLSPPDNDERKSRDLAAATTELERLFRKEDFRRMKVIGQFNLSFIVGKIGHDLFIVDQHAADEKYNFERLCQSTILNQQPLLRPLRLELTPEEEVVVSINMDIIRRNGFTLEEDPEAPPGFQFKLKAVPFSKNLTFGAEDLKDLISSLADDQGECAVLGSYKMDASDSVCPSRVRAMLASRACRSSVMIGDPLGRNEMQKILRHLADLKSPWNCPHGRPTMGHLVDLTSACKIHQEDEEFGSPWTT